jgi:hypothetical protein
VSVERGDALASGNLAGERIVLGGDEGGERLQVDLLVEVGEFAPQEVNVRRGAAARRQPPSYRGQPFGRQFPGLGSSIRLTASAGTSETTTVTRSTLPSLRTTCTSWP